MVEWESSPDVVCVAHGVPQGGLGSCGAGASAELLLQALKGVLAKKTSGTCCSEQFRPANVPAHRGCLAVGWAGVRAWSSSFFLNNCFRCLLTDVSLLSSL